MYVPVNAPTKAVDESLNIGALKAFEPNFGRIAFAVAVGIAEPGDARRFCDQYSVTPGPDGGWPREPFDEGRAEIHPSITVNVAQQRDTAQAFGLLFAVVFHFDDEQLAASVKSKRYRISD